MERKPKANAGVQDVELLVVLWRLLHSQFGSDVGDYQCQDK
jgi:hypothetical protein